MSVNKAILVGFVGKDPEIRRTQAGAPVATFSLATSEHWRDKATGERKERTEWHRVVVFNEALITSVVEPFVKKGSRLYVEGAISTRKYTQNNVEKYTTEITLKAFNATIQLLDRAERAPAPDADAYGSTSTRDAAAGKPAIDDEIPF